MVDDIGDLAENYFERLAIRAGITTNRATKDREGWDFIVQFPYRQDEAVPYDQREQRSECFVQVKGTRTKQRSEPISLSNWEKLVKTDLPVFFVIFVFGDEDRPKEVYLIHVGEEWISRALKRLRELALKSNAPLHKKTLNIKWTAKNQLSTLDGTALFSEMESYIDGMSSYSASKRLWREQAGDYVPQEMVVSKMGRDTDIYEEFVNLSLGLSTSIDVDSVILKENIRFGIHMRKSELGPGTFSFAPDENSDAVPIKLHFFTPPGGRSVTFEALAFSPYTFFSQDDLPKEFQKYRITFPFGQIILMLTGKSTLTFKIPPEYYSGGKSLQELVDFGHFLMILYQSSTSGISIEMSKEGTSLVTLEGTLPLDASLLDEFLRIVVQAILDAEFLVDKIFDLPMEVETSLSEIVEQRNGLAFCRLLLDVSRSAALSGLRVKSKKLSGEFREGMIKGMLFVNMFQFGEAVLALGLALVGTITQVVEESQDNVIVVMSNLRIVDTILRVPHEAIEDLREELSGELTQSLQNKGFGTVDFQSF